MEYVNLFIALLSSRERKTEGFVITYFNQYSGRGNLGPLITKLALLQSILDHAAYPYYISSTYPMSSFGFIALHSLILSYNFGKHQIHIVMRFYI